MRQYKIFILNCKIDVGVELPKIDTLLIDNGSIDFNASNL